MGAQVAFVNRAPDTGTLAIFRCSVETGERRARAPGRHATTTTHRRPSLPTVDTWPSSAEVPAPSLGTPRVLQPSAAGGEPRQLTADRSVSSVVWDHDGCQLCSTTPAADTNTACGASPLSGGPPQRILANVRAARPSIGRDGKRLLYQLTTTDMNIWQAPLPSNHDERGHDQEHRQVAASTSIDVSPQFSPDGNRIAFVSVPHGPRRDLGGED